ncbi:MAG: fluoride efflux transporter CrcB [Anaerolineales bacterium]
MSNFLLVGLGGFAGAMARYALSGWAAEKLGAAFPYGTFIVNVVGSFALGLFLTVASERILLAPQWRLLFGVGFVGAFTTFSTYTFESAQLLLGGGRWLGFVNLLGTLLIGLSAVMLGIMLGRRL